MLVVALTGGIGCGKSEAMRIFAELGVPVVDVDVISHQLTAPGMPLLANIRAAFGDVVFDANGALNRAKLRDRVFKDEAERSKLNAILHPTIQREALNALQSHADHAYVILAIPLLDPQSPYLAAINRILVIDCDEATQIARVQARSQLSEAEIRRIMQAQSPRAQRLQMADEVIENNGHLEKLREKILAIHQKYISTCIVSKTTS